MDHWTWPIIDLDYSNAYRDVRSVQRLAYIHVAMTATPTPISVLLLLCSVQLMLWFIFHIHVHCFYAHGLKILVGP